MKTIKLTNEQAAALYKKDPELRTTLLHEFTDEELGIKPKPLRWEDLGRIEGYFIEQDSTYRMTNGTLMNMPCNRNVYPCLKDAKKALAHCQLLQLAKHYNKCEQHEIKSFYFVALYNVETKSIHPYGLNGENAYGGQIKFINQSDLEKCIEDNRDLWEIYCRG
jgi:hypothetical protein